MNNIDQNVKHYKLWCPNCAFKEDITILNTVSSENRSLSDGSIDLDIAIKCNCFNCKSRMINIDSKFLNICNSLREYDIEVIAIKEASNKTPASATIKFDHTRYLTWSLILCDSKDFESHKIRAEENINKEGIEIISSTSEAEYSCKESDNRLIRFLEEFIEYIKEYGE